MLLILGACSLVFFFLPSSKDKHIARVETQLRLFTESQKGRIATVAEVNAIRGAHSIVARRIDGAPTLYLFMPNPNNVAILGRLHDLNSGIDGYTVILIPVPELNSPTSERALGMCFLRSNDWKMSDLISVASDIRPRMQEIDVHWAKVSELDKKLIHDKLEANKAVLATIGNMGALVLDGKRGYLKPDNFHVFEYLQKIQELRKIEGKTPAATE